MKISVLGDGGWGTALAILLKNKGFDVSLWGAFKEDIEAIKKTGENKKTSHYFLEMAKFKWHRLSFYLSSSFPSTRVNVRSVY